MYRRSSMPQIASCLRGHLGVQLHSGHRITAALERRVSEGRERTLNSGSFVLQATAARRIPGRRVRQPHKGRLYITGASMRVSSRRFADTQATPCHASLCIKFALGGCYFTPPASLLNRMLTQPQGCGEHAPGLA
jgi:hypothetical protein